MAFNNRHATVSIIDGGGSTLGTYEDVGDFTFSEIEEGGRASAGIRNRGTYVGDVEGDDIDVTGSFTVRLKRETGTHASNFRPLDSVMKTGSIAGATSDNPITTGPWLCRLKFEVTDGTNTMSATIRYCRLRVSLAEAGNGDTTSLTVTYTGKKTVTIA